MKIVNFPQQNNGAVGATGVCPHCGVNSYFKPVGGMYLEDRPQQNIQIGCNAAQCESCKDFVLVIAHRPRGGHQPFILSAVHPLGKPEQTIEAGIPANVAADFQEAMRCRWIRAFRATVVMCRRAIQASCLDKKADAKKKLTAQIDELAQNGHITEPLRLFAHEVRLEGNDGAHPDPDGLSDVTEKDADDIVEFTREYLHHVYVMPDKLAKRKQVPAGTQP